MKQTDRIRLNSLFLILILTFAILLTGQEGCDGNPLQDPHHGSQGISMAFHEDSPPSETVAGRSFKIIIQVTNEGASDITGGIVTLTPIILDEIVLQGSREKNFNLYGRSLYIPQGQKTSLVWSATAASGLTGDVKSKVGASAEYNYQTNATTGICIDPNRDTDTSAGGGPRPCTMPPQLNLGDQGAPIAVDTVGLGIDLDSKELIFTIHVTNVGGGTVIGDGKGGSDLNQVSVYATLGGSQLSCDSPKVWLTEGEGEVVCTASYSSTTAYQTSLFIKLDYKYRQLLPPTEILIKAQRVMG